MKYHLHGKSRPQFINVNVKVASPLYDRYSFEMDDFLDYEIRESLRKPTFDRAGLV